MKKNIFLATLAATILLGACSKTDTYVTEAISDYAPLTVGKYITYQLDSLIFADNIIPKDTVITYQIKQVVQDSVTDNLGRKGFSIRRYIRKKNGDAWVADNTFRYTNTGTTLEFTENNLRFLKLHAPIKNDYTWKGNTYLDTYSAESDIKYYDNWDYTYDSVNTPLQLGTFSLDSTLKVNERDEVLGNPNDVATYSEINFSVSKYAKSIGLVYHKFIHQEYQPPTSGPKGYKLGYGVTLTMIDHN